jgi:hypothetical protein
MKAIFLEDFVGATFVAMSPQLIEALSVKNRPARRARCPHFRCPYRSLRRRCPQLTRRPA